MLLRRHVRARRLACATTQCSDVRHHSDGSALRCSEKLPHVPSHISVRIALCRTVITVEDDHAHQEQHLRNKRMPAHKRTTLVCRHAKCVPLCGRYLYSSSTSSSISYFRERPRYTSESRCGNGMRQALQGSRRSWARPSRHTRANPNVCHEDRVSEMYAARRFERYADCTYV